MLLMFEQGTQSGITQAVHRYVQVNNKYVGDRFDPRKQRHHILYLDANNLYGWMMSQDLLTGG